LVPFISQPAVVLPSLEAEGLRTPVRLLQTISSFSLAFLPSRGTPGIKPYITGAISSNSQSPLFFPFPSTQPLAKVGINKNT